MMEDSLVVSADSMYSTLIPDFRVEYCEKFVKQLVRTLRIPGSYKYPFDSLSKIINIIAPDDKAFRVFNWAIAPDDISLRYYGAIQLNSEDLKLYPLIDNSSLLSRPDEDEVLGADKWMGCLFYNIITRKVNGETIYNMLGLNDGNPVSTKKMIDPMRITDKGPVFGAPVFAINSDKNKGQQINRFILEYKKGVHVGMNWDDNLKAILFDDLVSQINDPNRKYTFIPSGQYNGLRWQDNQWHFVSDIIPILNLKDGEAPSGN